MSKRKRDRAFAAAGDEADAAAGDDHDGDGTGPFHAAGDSASEGEGHSGASDESGPPSSDADACHGEGEGLPSTGAAAGGSGGVEEDGDEWEDDDVELGDDEPSGEGATILGDASSEDDGPSSSGSGSEGGEAARGSGGGGGSGKPSFLSGDKAPSFARAFAKIMKRPAKSKAAAGAAVSILADSASVAKRRAQEDAHEAEERKGKQHRQDMRQRGRMVVTKRGEDPEADAKEKQLQRLATRGVVLLFNAVHKAQKAKSDALAAGQKAPKLSKASFIAELKAASASGNGQPKAAGVLAAAGANAAGAAAAAAGTGAPGWAVLGQGFPGLGAGTKMKDWDKGEDSEESSEHLQDVDSSGDDAPGGGGDGDEGDEGDDDGW